MGMTRPQILEDLLDGLLDEGTSVCQRSFKHGQDLGLVDVRQILAGLDLPPEFLVAFDAQDAAQFHPVDQDLPDILFQLLQQFVRVFISPVSAVGSAQVEQVRVGFECFLEPFLRTHQQAESLPDFRFGLSPRGDQHCQCRSGNNFCVHGFENVFRVEQLVASEGLNLRFRTARE